MAQKYSGWFLEKLFPAWLFMSSYHGFYSGTGELNSRNHMKHAEWFHPWAKHTFTGGKQISVRAHVQFRASSLWPVLHPCRHSAESCSLVAELTWLVFFLWRLPPIPGERLVWVERLDLSGWNGLILSLLSVPLTCGHCRWKLSRALTTLPLGAPWSQVFPRYSQGKLKWLHFPWKKEKREERVEEIETWTCQVCFCGIKFFKTGSLLAVSQSLLVHKTVGIKHFGFAEIKDFGNFPCQKFCQY